MLDLHRLRMEPDVLVHNLARRGIAFPIAEFSTLEATRRDLQVRTQQLQSERNRLSKEFGLRKAKGEDAEPLRVEVQNIAGSLEVQEAELSVLLQRQRDWVAQWPNTLHDSVPDGRSSEENVEIHRWGAPPVFSFPPQDHVTLGEGLKAMDFEAAARISGSRFVVLLGPIARLHRALAQFMLDFHTAHHGYREIQVPYLVTANTMFGTGQLPKFAGDFFQIQERDLLLVPTAESPVTNMVRDQILSMDQLPLRWVCHSPCFRSEAGSYGKDTRGMIRQHQFDKVELVQVVHPDESHQALESLTRHAEIILEQLELPYRRMLLCAGDTGFSAAKTYDLEVWLPGSNAYREISSCSNCTDFQARRMMARYRNAEGKPELLHTLNGSGLAVGRTLVAVLENYQQADGSVKIPKVLQGYLGGLRIMSRDAG